MASTTIGTPFGPFTIIAKDTTVLAAGFTGDVAALLPLVHPDLRTEADAELDLITKSVDAYCDGNLTAIDEIAVTQRTGGAFLAQSWDLLRSIPAESPVTYREFAERAGRPAAIRAAAQACARNAAALFVPCHRVVRTGGGMGGYRWGVSIKQQLLAHERQMTKTRS
jgi:methylated-DNA-[protein]-cysteine S-methyltransferase